MMTYQARSGSTADLVLRHLQAHGPTSELALAAAIDLEVGELGGLLGWPISKGALRKVVQGDEWVYSLGDGEPVPPPQAAAPSAPQQILVSDADRTVSKAIAKVKRRAPAQPPTQPAPSSSSADLGDDDDDESNSGRARRLAGGGDDRGSGQRGKAGHGKQVNGAAEHDAGLLRAQQPRAAHQGDGEELNALRIALWSDGSLEIVRRVGEFIERLTLTREETRQVVGYLDSIALDVARGEGVS